MDISVNIAPSARSRKAQLNPKFLLAVVTTKLWGLRIAWLIAGWVGAVFCGPATQQGEQFVAVLDRLEIIASHTHGHVQSAVAAGRLKGQDSIGVRVGRAVNQYKMAKHLELDIEDDSFAFHRKRDSRKLSDPSFNRQSAEIRNHLNEHVIELAKLGGIKTVDRSV